MQAWRGTGHVLGGSLLIAGTTIGVGMLALPVVTGAGGFVPSMVVYLVCWLFMLSTGLLMLEVCLWMPEDANLNTMTEKLLGPIGRNICWAVYLFLFVTVMVAHIASGGAIVQEITGGGLGCWASILFYVFLFSPIIYLGTRWVDRINMIFLIGVAVSYLFFISVSWDQVQWTLLKRMHWSEAWLAMPVLFTAFTYQVIIPTLCTYMERDVKKIRKAIFCGTSIPLVIYLVWELLILGIVPADGPHGLIAAAQKGQNAVMPLKQMIQSPALFAIGKAFAFFTLTTSYIALALAHLDFLADGLKVKKRGINKIGLCLVVFVPPTLIALTYPDVFLSALGYAGGFSCAILFGLFPPLMAWYGRYVEQYDQTRQLPGQKKTLIFLIFFVVCEIGLEAFQELAKQG